MDAATNLLMYSGALSGRASGSGPKNTIVATPASFILTGQSAGLIYARTALVAALGTFALTGVAAGTVTGRSLTAAQGTFALTGQDASLVKATPGAYTLTAAQGTFILTGDAMTPLTDRLVPADFGTFALSGQAANLLTTHSLTAAQGTFALTGVAATLTKSSSFALAYQSSASTASKTSPINYGTLGYAAGATRTICVIQFYGGTPATVTGVTVGGIALAPVSGAYINQGDATVDVWESTGTLSGTSGVVEVTFGSNNTFDSAVALYSLTTATPTAGTPATAYNGFASSVSAGPASVPSGGGAIFATFPYNGDTATITSGNATIDASPVSPGSTRFYFVHTTATGSQTVTMTYAGGSTIGVASLVPWGP